MTTLLLDADLAAAQDGDPTAMGRVLEAHRRGVYRYGLRVCRTTEDAEDALQTTLWAATRAIRSFRGTASSLASWMFTIIRRECFRLFDRRGETATLAAIEARPGSDPPTDDTVAARLDVERLAAAIAALDPLHREVILLRDIEELTAPEAAERLGISVHALKSRLHRARASLRHQLGEVVTACG